MTGSLRDYARLGLVHHMLHPACANDPELHRRTLLALLARDDIDTLDCCLPRDPAMQAELTAALRASRMEEIAISAHISLLRDLAFTAPDPGTQSQVRRAIAPTIVAAWDAGCTAFVFASGGPPPAAASAAHYAAFAEFCRWFTGQLAVRGITALLEPFDTAVDKRFLYGPTTACVDLIDSLAVGNLGIELDVAHLPLLGEDFAAAIGTVAPHLRRVHLGNCVCRDPNHPRYGDTHPPPGYTPGEIDVPELTVILRSLLEIDYLNAARRPPLVLETTTWPGRDIEWTLTDAWRRLERAWAAV